MRTGAHRIARLRSAVPGAHRIARFGAIVALALALAACGGSHARRAPTTLTVRTGRPGYTIHPGFAGLSFEYWNLPTYAGTDPAAIDPVFEQLVRNLAPSQRPYLRIGGVSTDHTWTPAAGRARPPWARFTLAPRWLALARAVAGGLDAKLILGVNFEAGSEPLAARQARTLVQGIGRRYIAGLELGNEPELYASFPWYRGPNGVRHHGRARPGWSPAAFDVQWHTIARALPGGLLAGPAVGSPRWRGALAGFIRANPGVALLTIHAYPLKRCRPATRVTAAQLLSRHSSTGLAELLAPDARAARHAGIPIRVDEMNSVSCGGEAGLSDSFASALWAVDALFALADVGIDGVNLHTTPGVSNHLFTVRGSGRRWVGDVYPIYYGLLLFEQAAPPGSRLEPVTGARGPSIRAWATRATDGTTRVVLINTAATGTRTLIVRLRGGRQSGTIERLSAPGLHALSAVTLGGTQIAPGTTSGLPAGTPKTTSVGRADGGYSVRLPHASAVLLTVGAR